MTKQFPQKQAIGNKPGPDPLAALILVGAVIAAYLPVWSAGFIWDDDRYITASATMHGLKGLKLIWTTSAANISPLTFTTFWVEHALWGFAPLPYHLVNVLMQAACAVALWHVLRSLQVPGAWLGAAIWALHPVQVESVAWIIEMKNTESGLFFLLSILFFLRWLKIGAVDAQAAGDLNYRFTLVFAALAMASKSSTVILPVVLCLTAWWVEGRWYWRNLSRVAPMLLMAVVAGISSLWAISLQKTSIDPQWVGTWPQRLVIAGDAVWFYLGKLVWPHPLMTMYPRWQVDAGQWFSWVPLLAAMIVLLLLWLKRESWSRPWFFAFAWFLVCLLPGLGFVANPIFRFSLGFDHLQYLAAMGPLALAGAGIARGADLVIPKWPVLQQGLCAVLLLILGLASWHRASVYRNQGTLWTDALAKNPDAWGAYNGLGTFLISEGRVQEAIARFEKASELDAHSAEVHNNLGGALYQNGQLDDAIAQLQLAVDLSPADAAMHKNLGDALLQKGRVDESMVQYRKAVEINPAYAEAQSNLGVAFSQQGRMDEAMAQYQKALEIDPNFAPAHKNLGQGLLQKGRVDEAITQFQEALRLNPQDNEVRENLEKAQQLQSSGQK